MANALASKEIWTLNSASQGKIRLRRMEKYSFKSDRKKEAKTGVGEEDPIGITQKPGAITISFDFFTEQGKPKPDWKALEISGEPVALTRQIVGGQRFQYPECYVSSVDGDGDNEGSHKLTVEVIAMTEKALS